MSQQDHRADDSDPSTGIEKAALAENNLESVKLAAARIRATEEAEASIARQLNGPLTALSLYMNEIKQRRHEFPEASGSHGYLHQVVDNAVQQLESVCAAVKQMSDRHPPAGSDCRPGRKRPSRRASDSGRTRGLMVAPDADRKPLTRREREVLGLISEGCSNKQGALRMSISPRTFESHRAEAMRKLGARNTADLVRKVLFQPA